MQRNENLSEDEDVDLTELYCDELLSLSLPLSLPLSVPLSLSPPFISAAHIKMMDDLYESLIMFASS